MEALSLDLTKRYTYANYLTWKDDIRRELIDGFVHLMGTPTIIHQDILGDLRGLFRSFIRKRKVEYKVMFAPYDVVLPIDVSDIKNATNVVQPDLFIVKCPVEASDCKYIGAPELVVEILSPSTAKKDLQLKYILYERAGVKEYWIITQEGILKIHYLQDGKYDSGTVFDIVNSYIVPVKTIEGFEIDIRDIFIDLIET